MTEGATTLLPSTLRGAFRAELRRALHPPYEAPSVVVANGLLVAFFWFLVPASANMLFAIHGALAFPAVLASWMYSDVPATNVLGGDARRAVAALDDPAALRRLLYAKNAVLWVLVVPFCVVVAVVVGLAANRPLATIFSVLWIAVVPVGALGVSAWQGIYFPYHPMKLTLRWANRHPWGHMINRWIILITMPYLVVPALTGLIILPTLALWTLTTPHWLSQGLPDSSFAWGASLSAVVAVVVLFTGTHLSVRLVRRRRDKLRDYLSDPSKG